MHARSLHRPLVSNFGHYATYENDIRSLSSYDRIVRGEEKIGTFEGKKRLARRPFVGERTVADSGGLPAFPQLRNVTSRDYIKSD